VLPASEGAADRRIGDATPAVLASRRRVVLRAERAGRPATGVPYRRSTSTGYSSGRVLRDSPLTEAPKPRPHPRADQTGSGPKAPTRCPLPREAGIHRIVAQSFALRYACEDGMIKTEGDPPRPLIARDLSEVEVE
jgi:hypothetical protein